MTPSVPNFDSLADLAATYGRIEGHRPWPRVTVDAGAWRRLARQLSAGRLSLLGLWGDEGQVHAAVADDEGLLVATLECPDGRFDSLAASHPPALRLERTIRDLFGFEPAGLPDGRPWLDHARWGVLHPLGRATEVPATGSDYPFLPAEGESLHQIPVGPVHAGIIEPGHFRFTANGETVVRLEERLGWVHKGIEKLMAGADPMRGAELAGRCSGDSTVAYALAFARATEAALNVEVPPRAHWLRAIMAELERIANHLGDIGAVCNDAAFAIMHAHCGVLRERVLRAADAAFGHRLMRDRVVPGGVVGDVDARGFAAIRAALDEIERRFPALVELYENTASLQDRTGGAGVLKAELARQYAAGGFVGRASGRAFDARRFAPYPPYNKLAFQVPVLNEGDVDARVRIRMLEVDASVQLVRQFLERLPGGELWVTLPQASGEGIALVEGFRGDVLVWLRLAHGRISRCHLRDPSWFQWPLLEAAIEGNIVADFPLCNKSFNCSYSGHDL
jgi:Ni,Fe-hydrogenase III large subunit